MTNDRQNRIRQRAHQIWELTGKPEGQHNEHWLLAKAEIDSEHETIGGPTRLSEASDTAANPAQTFKPLAEGSDSSETAPSPPDKAPTDSGKLSRVAKGEELEVMHLAETTDLSPNQAKALLRKHGNDWAKIETEAKNFKAES